MLMRNDTDLTQRDFLRKHLAWKKAELENMIGELIRLTVEVHAIEDAIDLEIRVRRGRSIHKAAVEANALPVLTDADLPADFGDIE